MGPPRPPWFVPEIEGVGDAFGRVKEPLGEGETSAGEGDWVSRVGGEGEPPPGFEGEPPFNTVSVGRGLVVLPPNKPIVFVPTMLAVPPPRLKEAVDCSPPPLPIVEEEY